jgi:hypothetical protein
MTLAHMQRELTAARKEGKEAQQQRRRRRREREAELQQPQPQPQPLPLPDAAAQTVVLRQQLCE